MFGTRYCSTEDEERFGRLTQVTFPEKHGWIRSVILDDRRIFDKKIT
jgi:hypothetical protein